MRGKFVAPEAVIGGTILNASYWGSIEVLGNDGLQYEINIVMGHSGPEFECTETASSVAKRGAKTRKEKA